MPSNSALNTAAEAIRNAQNLVVFTGAGVSAESGIPTFRDDDGFWRRFPPERFATWRGIVSTAVWRPSLLAEFVQAVIEPIARATPNASHRAIAELDAVTDVTVVTQNVDRLHQEAGSRLVFEVHGSLFDIVGPSGRIERRLSRTDLVRVADALASVPRTWLQHEAVRRAVAPLLSIRLSGLRRPRVVLFGDAMAEPDWGESCAAAESCDVMLIVGTSATVLPAAMLPQIAKRSGATVIAVDPAEREGADMWLRGTACEVLPELIGRAR